MSGWGREKAQLLTGYFSTAPSGPTTSTYSALCGKKGGRGEPDQ